MSDNLKLSELSIPYLVAMPILNTKLITDYKNWLKEGLPGLSTATHGLYFRIARNLLNYLESHGLSYLNDINIEILTQFIHVRQGHPPYSFASVKVREAALELFFSWVYYKGLARENAMVSYRRSKIVPKQFPLSEATLKVRDLTVLSASEQKTLLCHPTPPNFLNIRDRFIVTFLLASGLTGEELLNLSNKDVDVEKSYVEVWGINKEKRRVNFNTEICRKDYEAWLEIHPLATQEIFPLFINTRLAPLNARALHRAISQYLVTAGITKRGSFGARLLRQTAIANALKKGLNLEKVRQHFGIETYEHIKGYTTRLQL